MRKKLRKLIIGDTKQLRWKDFDHKKVYLALAGVILVILLILVLILSPGDEKKKISETEKKQTSAETDTQEDQEKEAQVRQEIEKLITTYFQGIAEGNVDMVAGTVDVLTEEEKSDIIAKSDYIESYNNIVCHIKPGMDENSRVVFVYYDMKILNIDTLAPGMPVRYVYLTEDGTYKIFNGDASEEMENYVFQMAAQEDVAALIDEVELKYQEAMEADENLKNFNTRIQESKAEADTTPDEAPPAEEGDGSQELTDPVNTVVTDNVRMRLEHSSESGIVTVLATGTDVKVYANYEDGWSKISFNEYTGYCKTEFLQSTEGVPMLAGDQTVSLEEPAAQPDAQATPVNATKMLTDTIKIRADRSADSQRVATAYKSELVTVIESYSDGWSKVTYQGTTGYCMSQYLADPQ